MGAFFMLYQKIGRCERQITTQLNKTINSTPHDTSRVFDLENLSLGQSISYLNRSDEPINFICVDSRDYHFVGEVRLDNRTEILSALDNQAEKNANSIELIIKAYIKWGEGFCNYLLGDFAFVIYDVKNDTIITARDHIGIKPLYYHENDDFILISNSMEVILAHPEVSQTYNEDIMVSWIVNSYLRCHTDTFYDNISRCPRATEIYFSHGQATHHEYWDMRDITPLLYETEAEYITELDTLLQTAIRDRVQTSYPISAHLSGGLDSVPIAILAREMWDEKEKPFHTFNWCRPKDEDTERVHHEWSDAREIATAKGFIHHEIEISSQTIKDTLLNHDISLDGTTMYEYERVLLPQAKALGIRTILSGFGGDEMMTARFKDSNYPAIRRGDLVSAYRAIAWESPTSKTSRLRLFHRLFRAIVASVRPKNRLHKKIFMEIKERSKVQLDILASEYQALGVTLHKPFDNFMLETLREKQLQLTLSGYHQERLESWASMGRKAGVNYVYPLLDKRIVEFALAIPSRLYYRNGVNRYLYRKVIETFVPEFLLNKQKPPEEYRVKLLIELKTMAIKCLNYEEMLSESDLPYIDKKTLLKYLKTVEENRGDTLDNINELKSLTTIFLLLQMKKRGEG